jgi:hypothetical protein
MVIVDMIVLLRFFLRADHPPADPDSLSPLSLKGRGVGVRVSVYRTPCHKVPARVDLKYALKGRPLNYHNDLVVSRKIYMIYL